MILVVVVAQGVTAVSAFARNCTVTGSPEHPGPPHPTKLRVFSLEFTPSGVGERWQV
jgi:hypothetical protein